MSTVQKQIMDEIGNRLANIKKSNGYANDIGKIKREKINNFAGGDIPIIFYWGENDVKIGQEFGNEKRSFNIGAAIFVRTNDNPFTDTAFDAAADVKTSLNRTNAAPKISDIISINLGGLVSSLMIDEIIPIVGEGQAPFCGATLSITAEYFVSSHDSFTILDN